MVLLLAVAVGSVESTLLYNITIAHYDHKNRTRTFTELLFLDLIEDSHVRRHVTQQRMIITIVKKCT